MNNDIEADYLVDKLAGRLKKYFRSHGDQWYRISDVGYQMRKHHNEHYWDESPHRVETLEEYRQRKEQTE